MVSPYEGAYTPTPPPHEGDTQCVACGVVMDPLASLLTRTGRCVRCDRAAQLELMRNRMVAP